MYHLKQLIVGERNSARQFGHAIQIWIIFIIHFPGNWFLIRSTNTEKFAFAWPNVGLASPLSGIYIIYLSLGLREMAIKSKENTLLLLLWYAKGKGSLTTWNDKAKIDVSSEGPSSGVSSGGRGKPRVFLYELIQKHHVTK